jgi:hypothetical protein
MLSLPWDDLKVNPTHYIVDPSPIQQYARPNDIDCLNLFSWIDALSTKFAFRTRQEIMASRSPNSPSPSTGDVDQSFLDKELNLSSQQNSMTAVNVSANHGTPSVDATKPNNSTGSAVAHALTNSADIEADISGLAFVDAARDGPDSTRATTTSITSPSSTLGDATLSGAGNKDHIVQDGTATTPADAPSDTGAVNDHNDQAPLDVNSGALDSTPLKPTIMRPIIGSADAPTLAEDPAIPSNSSEILPIVTSNEEAIKDAIEAVPMKGGKKRKWTGARLTTKKFATSLTVYPMKLTNIV